MANYGDRYKKEKITIRYWREGLQRVYGANAERICSPCPRGLLDSDVLNREKKREEGQQQIPL